jgi:hypothetical protein
MGEVVEDLLCDRTYTQVDKTQHCHPRDLPRRAVRQNCLRA